MIHTKTWLNNPIIAEMLLPAIGETTLMVVTSTFFSTILVLPLGVFLAETRRGGLIQAPIIHQVTSIIVYFGRAIPFISLAVVVLFILRVIELPVLENVGWPSFTIALIVSAVPYFARLIASNVRSVTPGKVEAAHMMGASRLSIMSGVLVREALPAIIQSSKNLTITIIGYSAMSLAVGGGGLGALAIKYGYQRNNFDVMITVVIVVLFMVQLVQTLGDQFSKLVDHRSAMPS